jgi:hypothetical protein
LTKPGIAKVVVAQHLSASVRPFRSTSAGNKARQCAKIAELRLALLNSGFVTLDGQAKVLALSRSTTWVILKCEHKAGLSASVINRMLNSPALPPAVRQVIEEYVKARLAGDYGHSRDRLRAFRAKLEAVKSAQL